MLPKLPSLLNRLARLKDQLGHQGDQLGHQGDQLGHPRGSAWASRGSAWASASGGLLHYPWEVEEIREPQTQATSLSTDGINLTMAKGPVIIEDSQTTVNP